MTIDELTQRLRNGESVDTIAQEMARMLNMAQETIDKERDSKAREIAFERYCADAAIAMNDAIDAYAHWKDVDVEGLTFDADTVSDIIQTMVSVGGFLSVLSGHPNKNNKNADRSASKNFADVVDKFLRDNGIT